jgi:ubiquinone/menaquinone biosynthesis C-methylase UbiE
MPTSGSYDVSTAHQDRDAEVARLADQASLGWKKEARVLEGYGFRDGMSIVELGSGPGFVTRLVLDHFPKAQITCVERDETLIADAKRYLSDDAGRVTFVNASVDATGLPTGAFDAAYARLLFQHLPDPAAAALETFRILGPGAPFVIYDVDDDLDFVTDPDIPGLETVLARMREVQKAQGGDRYIGRRMLRVLKGAGFEDLEMEAITVNSETDGLNAFLHQFDPGRLTPLIQAGVVSQEEADGLIAQRAEFLASDPFVIFVFLTAGGRKPPTAAAPEG